MSISAADMTMAEAIDDTIHTCCQMTTLRHLGTCHDCGAVEVPMDPRCPEQRGEPICINCARNGAYDP